MRRFKRADRLSGEIMRAVADIIRDDVRDPRLGPMISITRAEVTNDMKYATLHVSIFGKEKQKKDALAALRSASGFIRGKLGEKMRIRVLPEVRFVEDSSIEHGARIAQLLREAGVDEDAKKEEKEE